MGHPANDTFWDAHVGYDATGTGYYTSQAYTSTATGYFVLTTTNSVNWSDALPIVTSDNNSSRSGAALAVDGRSSGQYAGSLYVFWSYLDNIAPHTHGLQMRYSRDGGLTWGTDIQVSDTGHEEAKFPKALVASDGTVYLSFVRTQLGDILNPPSEYIDRSTDGGVTWGTDSLISEVTHIGAPDKKGHELVINGNALCGEIRDQPCACVCNVSPYNSYDLYVVWNDGRWESNDTVCDPTAKHSDIAFSRSADRGQTWSAPIRVNDDPMANGIDQWQPTLAIGPNGLVASTWYDRRYSEDGFFYDTAYSQSADGGLTWSPSARVTDVSSDPDRIPDVKNVDDLGDYQALVFGPDYALPSWIDTRTGDRDGNFFTDRGVFTTTCDLSFSDVPADNTFYGSIRCLACRGFVSGYADGTFRPNAQITRGQIAKIVSNAAGYGSDPGVQVYEDVPPGHPFFDWVQRLSNGGVISGYPCGSIPEEPCVAPGNRPYFRPYANATRGQLSKIVSNAAGYSDPPTGQTFEDVPSSNPFYASIQRLASRGVMGGYACGSVPEEPCVAPGNRPYFRWGSDVTRGQSAKIAANTFLPGCQTPATR